MYPDQLGNALEDVKTAGVSDEDLRAIAADYESFVDRNEKNTSALRPSDTNPDISEVAGLIIRDQNWSGSSCGRYAQSLNAAPQAS